MPQGSGKGSATRRALSGTQAVPGALPGRLAGERGADCGGPGSTGGGRTQTRNLLTRRTVSGGSLTGGSDWEDTAGWGWPLPRGALVGRTLGSEDYCPVLPAVCCTWWVVAPGPCFRHVRFPPSIKPLMSLLLTPALSWVLKRGKCRACRPVGFSPTGDIQITVWQRSCIHMTPHHWGRLCS